MPRYTDADALMDWIIEAEEADPDWCVNPVKNIFDHIEELPPADVVEVVRCKDCKYYLHSSEVCGIVDTRLHFYETDKRWSDDCFCSWGERKETEDAVH